MGVAAYRAVLKSSGEPTAMLDENLIDLGLGWFQVSTPEKQVISIDHPFGIFENASAIDVGLIEAVDLIQGKFFIPSLGAEPLTINAYYIPLIEIGGANTYSLEIGGDILDDSNFKDCRANGGHRTKVYGIHDISFSIDRFSDLGDTFISYKRNRERVLVEVAPGGGQDGEFAGTYRGWFFVETTGLAGDIGDLESESISFNLAGNDIANFTFILFTP